MKRPFFAATAVTAVTAVLATFAVGLAAPPPTAAAPPPDANGTRAIPDGTAKITLITGDQVDYRMDAAGHIEADFLSETPFRGESGPDGTYVIPVAAEPYLASGLLDKELFDVQYLAEHGYDDAHRKDVPVIADVGGALQAKTIRQRTEPLAASHTSAVLQSVGAAALSVNKAEAKAFWTSLTRQRSTVTKLWLDQKVEPVLDESVPQIGAPEAWAKGYDGTGAKVAVLDTGFDTEHADLAGKVVASQSFIPGEPVDDLHGHGTHVASTIAGSGSASGGQYKGVAPGADLLVGKVLSNAGSGSVSQIIAGMEWATGQGADIVSMSLGAGASDGSDILSQTVNELTESTGSLFVIAAGNDGPDKETVATPGAAELALTVGAVDKQDKLASFSSRGPLVTSAELKPEITAPGVAITAARAGGTTLGTPVDTNYTTLSGTSMATPHVAGAAAILLQRHPDWTAAQLKSQLAATAKDGGYLAWEQGAGRVDVARSVSQQVTVDTASISPGVVVLGSEPRTTRLTYANPSAEAVTLTLRGTLRNAAGEPAPAGLLGLDHDELTVPAGGTATAVLTLDASGEVPLGVYEGVVLATSAGGDSLRVPIGLRVLPTMQKLTVRLVKPRPVGELSYFGITPWEVRRIDDVELPWREPLAWRETDDPNVMEGSALVPAGTYQISGSADWYLRTGTTVRQFASVAEPEVVVGQGTTTVIDLRKLVPVKVSTDRRTEVAAAMYAFTRTTQSGVLYGSWLGTAQWAYPTAEPKLGTFKLKVHETLAQPQAVVEVTADRQRMTVQPRYLTLAKGEPGQGRAVPKFARDRSLQLATIDDVRAGRDVRGKLVFADLRTESPAANGWLDDIKAALTAAADAGAAGVLMSSELFPDLLLFGDHRDALRVPVLWLDRPEAIRLGALLKDVRRPAQAEIDAQLDSPFEYKLWFHELGRVPDRLVYTVRTKDLKRVDTSYHSELAVDPDESNSYEASHVYRPEDTHSIAIARWFDAPVRRTEYSNLTGPDVVWSSSYTLQDRKTNTRRSGHSDVRVTDLRAAQDDWGEAPSTPGQPKIDVGRHQQIFELCAACRQADTLWFTPLLLEGRGVHSMSGLRGQVPRLYAGGVQIPAGSTGRDFPLPRESSSYLLEATWTRGFPGSAYPSSVESSWSFRSPGTPVRDEVRPPYATAARAYFGDTRPAAYLPLIFLSYDVPLALDNTARAGHPLRFTVTAAGSEPGSGVDVRGLKLEVSYDDGAQWRSVPVRALGGGAYDVTLLPPGDSGGAVSMRANAWDAHGNRVTQTVMQAFGLRR
ncbi:S8 family peptidase [Flindersiella endophytica]